MRATLTLTSVKINWRLEKIGEENTRLDKMCPNWTVTIIFHRLFTTKKEGCTSFDWIASCLELLFQTEKGMIDKFKNLHRRLTYVTDKRRMGSGSWTLRHVDCQRCFMLYCFHFTSSCHSIRQVRESIQSINIKIANFSAFNYSFQLFFWI